MFELRCDRLHSDRPVRAYAAHVDVIGDLIVVADGQLVLAVPDFPPIELAVQLSEWLRDGMGNRMPFHSTTSEAEEVGIVRFLPEKGSRSWGVGSVWAEADPVIVKEEDLTSAINTFIGSLSQSLKTEFNVDPGTWLSLRP